MKIALICFTENGFQMEKRLVKLLETEGHGPCPWVSGRYAMQAASLDHEISFSPVKEGGLSAWAGERFGDSDGLIFVVLSDAASLRPGLLLRISGIKKRIQRFWRPMRRGGL